MKRHGKQTAERDGQSLSIQKYEAFQKIAMLGNITKAATQLGYSQSALSNIVAGLETEWKVKLLVREKYGVRLTPEGETILPYINRIVAENKAMGKKIAQLQQLESGVIRLGAFQSAYSQILPAILKAFTTQYPDIRFEFKHGGYREIEAMLTAQEVDCGFISLPTALTSVETVPIYRDRILAVFPPFTRAETGHFPVQELANEMVILQKEMDSEVLEMMKRFDIHIQSNYTIDNEFSILPMVANGVGMGILPELLVRDAPYTFTTQPLEPPAFRTIALAYHPESLTPAASKFLHFVTDRFRL